MIQEMNTVRKELVYYILYIIAIEETLELVNIGILYNYNDTYFLKCC